MMLNRILKILLIVFICIAIFFGGVTIYANWFDNSGKPPDLPDVEKARYVVYIKANSNVLFTNDYRNDHDGVYVLDGYWELDDNKYKYREIELWLDEAVFGEIEIKRR